MRAPKTGKGKAGRPKTKKAIIVSVSFTPDTFGRLEAMRIAKGLNTEQELIRVFVGDRLDSAGY